MESEARYTLVGAALVVLVLAVMLAAVWLARTGARSDFRYYTIYFERQSLEGLQVGGDVNMRGIKIGRIEDYSISRDNINRVKVTIQVDRRSPVSDNTVAVVNRNLLTGLANINLVTPGTPGPELTAAPPGEEYPVIGEGQSDMAQLTAAVKRLAITGASALGSLDQMLSDENREAFSATLANLRELSSGLSQRMGKLDEVADALQKSAREFARSSRDIAASVAEVSKSAQPVAAQTQATLRDLSRAAHALERATGTLAKRLGGAADTTALEISATAREIRASAELLARAADRLANPRAAILGPNPAQLGPGEKLR